MTILQMNKNIVDNIKHVVVLMMENRSFDHLFGDIPGVNGINNAEPPYNLPDPSKEKGKDNPAIYSFYINVDTQEKVINPTHAFGGMMPDILGYPNCAGYVHKDGPIDNNGKPIQGAIYPTQEMAGYYATNHKDEYVMSYFQHLPVGHSGRLKVLHTLAENFVICDNWYCDTPSDTGSNRLFMHCATNRGLNNNPQSQNYASFNTIYHALDQINQKNDVVNWAFYAWPTASNDGKAYHYCQQPRFAAQYNRDIANFGADVKQGKLPFYTFLCPSLNMHSDPNYPQGNSMHPTADVRPGENFIAQVYNILANSAIWNNTLFIITFDENGGFFDHVAPIKNARAPDHYLYPLCSKPTLFDYTMLGPRIPALLISPWLSNANAAKGIYQVDSTQYQNTSIIKFVLDLFAAQHQVDSEKYYLTKRDSSANSFANSQFWLASPAATVQSLDIYVGKDCHDHHIFPWGSKITGEAPFYPPQFAVLFCQNTIECSLEAEKYAADIATSGFTTVILGQWHVSAHGVITSNDVVITPAVISKLANFVNMLKQTAGSQVQQVFISFGPFATDFYNMIHSSAVLSAIQGILLATGLDGVDWDYEGRFEGGDDITVQELAQLTNWASSQGYAVSADPYRDAEKWHAVLQHTPGFAYWNFQYAIDNDVASYCHFLQAAGVNNAFVTTGYAAMDHSHKPPLQRSPAELEQTLQEIKKCCQAPCGAMLWNYEDMWPHNPDGYSAAAWAQAIYNVLG